MTTLNPNQLTTDQDRDNNELTDTELESASGGLLGLPRDDQIRGGEELRRYDDDGQGGEFLSIHIDYKRK